MPQNISYTSITSILLKEVNKLRNNPKMIIPILKQRLKKYDSNGNYFPLAGLNFSVKMKEGTKGVEELIAFIQHQRECSSLEWCYELHQAADKRCHFLSSTQQNNSLNRVANLEVGELVSQFTSWKGGLIQLTFYGFIQPTEFICELLLEDGHTIKENRIEIFSRSSAFIGIGINTHQKYRFVIVMIMATQVVNHKPFDIYHRPSNEKIEHTIQKQDSSDQPNCGIQTCDIY